MHRYSLKYCTFAGLNQITFKIPYINVHKKINNKEVTKMRKYSNNMSTIIK